MGTSQTVSGRKVAFYSTNRSRGDLIINFEMILAIKLMMVIIIYFVAHSLRARPKSQFAYGI